MLRSAFAILALSPHRYKPLRLKALLKPITKMYKPRAFTRQFAVAHHGREKTIYSGGSREGPRGVREWQTMEILECKVGVKRRTLHVTNKNANERGQEIFLIVIRFVTCEVR